MIKTLLLRIKISEVSVGRIISNGLICADSASTVSIAIGLLTRRPFTIIFFTIVLAFSRKKHVATEQ